MNQVAKSKWKSSRNSLAGKFFVQKINNLKDPEFHAAVNKAYEGEVQIYSGKDYHQNNKEEEISSDIEVYISPVYTGNFEIEGIVLVYLNPGMEDITALIRENKQLQSKAFLSNITHEFRTPLNWMLGFSELIRKENDIEKIKEYNRDIQQGGKVLLSLIDRLIEMSSIIRKETLFEKQEFSLIKILDETAAIISNEIRLLDKKINVSLNISLNDGRKDITIKSDQRKLKQVLTYLTHNAVKFTTSGYIEIGCRELPEEIILFYVKDTGIGISVDVLHYIYEIFRKEAHHSPFLTEGQGLGLTLTKNYISLMGGDIWVESESGNGAKFYFTIKNHNKITVTESEIIKSKSERRFSSNLITKLLNRICQGNQTFLFLK